MTIVSLFHTQLCTLGTPGHLYFWQTSYKYKVVHDLQAWLFTGTVHGTQTTFHLTIPIQFYSDGVPVIRTPEFPVTWLCLPRMKLSTIVWYAELWLQSHYTDIQKGISETMETKQPGFRSHLCSGYLLLQNKRLQSLLAIYYYWPHLGVDEA